MKQRPLFIVGTGRCGCTMLSNIISKHSDILVLSEFFVTLSPYAFKQEIMSGHEFWEILSVPRPKATHLLRHGIGIDEFLYQSEEGVPPILLTTLPFLTDQPLRLYDEVREFVLNLPIDYLSNQYIKLFNWFQERLKKKHWVERSGSSLRFIKDLRTLYPDSRFIHIFRDGRECAMSMNRHYAFRSTMIQSMVIERTGIDPFEEKIPENVKKQIGELGKILPDEDFDVEAFKNYKIPIENFGILWSSQIAKGCNYLKGISPDDLLNVCFEDILENPHEELLKVMKFIDKTFNDSILLNEMAAIVDQDKKPTWQHLPEEDKVKLERACKFGMKLLNYHK